jgi:hypothetical protein
LELVRQPNGLPPSAPKSSEESGIIINDAQGYQLEFISADYTFNRTTDCRFYGFPVSGLFSCIAYVNNTILSGECTSFIVT